jgi:hypothetical protein
VAEISIRNEIFASCDFPKHWMIPKVRTAMGSNCALGSSFAFRFFVSFRWRGHNLLGVRQGKVIGDRKASIAVVTADNVEMLRNCFGGLRFLVSAQLGGRISAPAT